MKKLIDVLNNATGLLPDDDIRPVGEGIGGWLSQFQRRLDAGEVAISEDHPQERKETALSLDFSAIPARALYDAQRLSAGELEGNMAYQAFREVWRRQKSAILWGRAGSGKSTLAALAAIHEISGGGWIRWINASSIPRLVRRQATEVEFGRATLAILDGGADLLTMTGVSRLEGRELILSRIDNRMGIVVIFDLDLGEEAARRYIAESLGAGHHESGIGVARKFDIIQECSNGL
jgi:hypothetical protein